MNIASKQIEWVLNKAAPTITLSKQSITLDSDNLTDTFTITANSTGNLSVTSSDDSIITVSLSGNTATVEGLTNGNVAITVNITEDDNYLSNSIPLLATCNLVSTTLNDNTPVQIQSAVANGQASSLWNVGDTIGITLVSGKVGDGVTLSGTYKFAILGFDHNNSKELPSDKSHSLHLGLSKNSSDIEIAFTDWTNEAGYGGYVNNSSSSYFNHNSHNNIGGWASSNMRTNICPSFLNCLPLAWQNVITAIPKYTDNTGGYSYQVTAPASAVAVTATTDKIWLLAEWEIFGARLQSNQYEQDSQEQYDYYKNGNSKVRYGHQQTSVPVWWWTRSVDTLNTNCFCTVVSHGGKSIYDSSSRMGFVPCFALVG